MSIFVYNFLISLYQLAIRIAAIRNPKARLWLAGRKAFSGLKKEDFPSGSAWIWMHCSSLGEFEQGRPVFERLKEIYPDHRFLLTFFSPSGYEKRKNYALADKVAYLPADTPGNARRFLDLVNPRMAIFVKYDYWYHFLKTSHERQIPLYIISAIFREEQPFFKGYGGLHRKMLGFFTRIFVQDDASRELLRNLIPPERVIVAGDTRFDRVAEIAGQAVLPEIVAHFSRNKTVLVAGSTWPADEELLAGAFQRFPELYLVIAPHEIGEKHLQNLSGLFPGAQFYSRYEKEKNSRVLIIDNIGMLSSLYQSGQIAYIGGGFGSGIHNTLEAAVYGVPVLFGPNYQRFREAVELIGIGGGFSISDSKTFLDTLKNILENETFQKESGKKAREYVLGNTGATESIVREIRNN